MDIAEWLEIGHKNKWCSKIVCETHDGVPMTDAEMYEFDEGGDPCIFVIRMFEDPEDFDNAEQP